MDATRVRRDGTNAVGSDSWRGVPWLAPQPFRMSGAGTPMTARRAAFQAVRIAAFADLELPRPPSRTLGSRRAKPTWDGERSYRGGQPRHRGGRRMTTTREMLDASPSDVPLGVVEVAAAIDACLDCAQACVSDVDA